MSASIWGPQIYTPISGAFGILLSEFSGADPTGVGDSTTAIVAALAVQATTGRLIIVDGRFRYTSTITVTTQGARFVGIGGITESASVPSRAASCFIKDFDGQGFIFAGDCQETEGVQYDCIVGKTGDNVQVIGSRWSAPSIAVTNAGRDGLRINADSGVYNTNLWHVGKIISRYNGRHGMLIDDPTGATDAGGGVCLYADMIGNGGDGIKCDNCTWNTFVNVTSQVNTGVGFRITEKSRSITVLGGDLEGNLGGAQGLIEVGSFSHTVIGAFYGAPACWTDSSGFPGKNVVAFFDSTIGASVTGSAVNVLNAAAAGPADVNLFADINSDMVATVRGTKSGTNGGTLALRTKSDGGAQVSRITIDHRGVTSILAGRVDKLVTLVYSASIAIDASVGTRYQVNVTNGSAWTLGTPTNPSAGQPITICVRNTSGGAAGAITWPTEFKMAAWTSPASGFSRSITLRYDGQFWIEESRTPADIPN